MTVRAGMRWPMDGTTSPLAEDAPLVSWMGHRTAERIAHRHSRQYHPPSTSSQDLSQQGQRSGARVSVRSASKAASSSVEIVGPVSSGKVVLLTRTRPRDG